MFIWVINVETRAARCRMANNTQTLYAINTNSDGGQLTVGTVVKCVIREDGKITVVRNTSVARI